MLTRRCFCRLLPSWLNAITEIIQFEKVLFKMSFTETLILSMFFFAILNGVILLFSFLTGRTGFLLYDNAWIIQVFFSFMYSIIQTSINRNGILKISDYNDLLSLVKKMPASRCAK